MEIMFSIDYMWLMESLKKYVKNVLKFKTLIII